MKKAVAKKHSPLGESLEHFLERQGLAEDARLEAQLRVLAFKIEEQRKLLRMSKAELAQQMATSRSQLDRILKPSKATITVEVLDRAARAVGYRLNLALTDF